MKLLLSDKTYNAAKSSTLIPLECNNCKKKFHVKKATIVAVDKGMNKRDLSFCHKACKTKKVDKIKRAIKNKTKSKPEMMLLTEIIKDFAYLQVHISDRTTLASGLELDVYLPEKEIAVEVNGITHYQPIYGEDKLERTQRNDKLKRKEAQQMGIRLLTIDVHMIGSRSMDQYIKDWYKKKLRPLLV